MGWLFPYGATRKSLIQQLTEDQFKTKEDGTKLEWLCLTHCLKGNILWSIRKIIVRPPNQPATESTFIGCDIMKPYKGEWGYKALCEEVHPFYYTCPLSYLDKTPIVNEEWREKVREFHRKRQIPENIKTAFKNGETVLFHLKNGWTLKLLSLRPLAGERRGIEYRIPRKLLDKYEVR